MKFIKPVMAAMLLACLLHLPYGYYSLVRFVAMVVFAVLAYQYYKEKNDPPHGNVWSLRLAVSALHENSVRARSLESDRCCCRCHSHCFMG